MRQTFIVLTKKRITLFATILAVIFIFVAVNDPAIVGASATTRELPIYCVQRDNKAVSLTFDAAWGNEDTQQLIDILNKYNVKATFFVVGFWVDKFPESVKALADAGNEVMSHSNDHAHFSKLSTDQIVQNVTASNNKIAAVTGVAPALFRCPYGEYDDHVIKALKSMNMYTIQWDVDSLDWKNLSAGEITQRVTSKVQPGSIILFHNAALHTPEALPGIIEYLLKNGYSIVPVSQLLLKGDYTIDHTGRQLPA
ncbi:polysaccharide deacetylase family sporulation protein PdaB [Sporobacter termitidis DSM 10068]|uniref:Polysaccharide deacetylase family sporulation protein PdaB n=1 Tax=Sporobacter termitidis DSM 10068 TaxID=1123282 RepID=A0A1M5Y6J6_9FIRM|nr:polysaccharide deacetylase family protein [Sporobacter termitidis]SHI07113.1 polysaccharide deacetylase family sporulation protein PdaB [Sporobacter termitidis DSM 10068]